MEDLSQYRLHANEGEEQFIPKYGVATDSRYFDRDSLVRMYGEGEVRKFESSRAARGLKVDW